MLKTKLILRDRANRRSQTTSPKYPKPGDDGQPVASRFKCKPVAFLWLIMRKFSFESSISRIVPNTCYVPVLKKFRLKTSPVGHFKLAHPWPGQIPPGRTLRLQVKRPLRGRFLFCLLDQAGYVAGGLL